MIKLTQSDGKPVYIVAEYIVMISHDIDGAALTVIHLANGKEQTVTEKIDDLVRLLTRTKDRALLNG